MTAGKPRSLKQSEIDDWFEDEVTRQLFEHIRIDIDEELQFRLQGGVFHHGDPQKTQEALVRSFSKEEVMQAYGSPEVVRAVLEGGFNER